MPKTERSFDVVEGHSERAIYFGVGGVAALGLGALLWAYRGTGLLSGLALVLLAGGVLCLGYAAYCAWQIRSVTFENLQCPFCEHENVMTGTPDEDVACENCHRMIPLQNGQVMPVFQVRCGFCNNLNYYSDKTEVLICEECDHEIPIAQEEGKPQKHVPRGYAVVDDDKQYELVLTNAGNKHEEVIETLQHMLALNRNQVKQMLDELPQTLLTGITRKKAEMLQAQLAAHDASAEFHALP